MKQSLLSYLRKLQNHQFAEAYELICSNLNVEELADADVQQAVENAQSYASAMNLLKNMKRQHPITEQMDAFKKQRHQYLLSLRGRVSYFLRSPFESERAAAKIVSVWLQSYHEFFKGASIHAQSRLVSNIFEELTEVPELASALEELHLDKTMEQVVGVTAQMRSLHLTRLKDTKQTQAKATQIRDVAYKHIATVWKTLEVNIALAKGEEAECKALFDAINWVIIDFKSLYLNKATRRETEKLKEGEKETPDETAPAPVG